MSKLFIIAKNELYRYFISPLAYVYLVSFLLLNGSFAFYFGHFFERGQADLSPMFAFQPWLYLLFIPGISMRLWAEEFRNKTVVQIITMPVSITSLVWGKFLAAWIFCTLALFLTFPFWIAVNTLGNADNSVIAIGYFGSFLLAGCMLAISETMSALTKNQVIALVLSVITNLLFFLSGLEYVLDVFRSFAPDSIIDMIASFSFLSHFDAISGGLFEARDMVFFLSIILLFNFTTVIIVSFRTSGTSALMKSTSRNYYVYAFLLLMIAFTGVNLLANNLLRRYYYDATEEKLFTLTKATENVLQNLPEPVTAKLYYSKILGERSPEFREAFDKVRLLLQQYRNLAPDKFSYRIYYPEPLDNAEDIAIASGLQALPIVDTSTAAFFGLTLTDAVERRQTIPFLALERQNLLEQDLTTALYLLNHRKKNLGILTTLPIFEEAVDNVASPEWEIVKQLRLFYNLYNIRSPEQLQNDLDALMLIYPRDLSPEMTAAVKDYSYNGGRVLAFLDIAPEARRNYAPQLELFKPSESKELEAAWGIKFHDEAVVADLGNSTTVDASSNYSRNPIFTEDVIQIYLTADNYNQAEPETALLKKMMGTSFGVFTPVSPKIEFIPLITAGKISQLMPAAVVANSVPPTELLRHFEVDDNPKVVAAKIRSLDYGKPFEVIVVGDSDLLYDSYWSLSKTLYDNTIFIPVLDNANFVLNALESLTGTQELIGLRGKSGRDRHFELVDLIRKDNLRQYQIKEKEILDKMELVKRGLQEIWGKKTFEGRETFTPDELAVIANIRKDLDKLRQELSTLKTLGNDKVEQIALRIKFMTIFAAPLLIVLLLSLRLLWLRRHLPAKSADFRFNRPVVLLTLCALALAAAGIWSVYDGTHQEISDYENTPLLPDLPQEINQISRITLTGHDRSLTFLRQKDGWVLQGSELPVLQDRIRSFLSALLEARFYEKKSAKMEHLANFGLAPVESDDSPNIRIELKDDRGRVISALEVGKYNIELGRGTQGAYVKFDNQFQVWLAKIELIDLSLNPNDWTYSHLWNLRFGRLASLNGDTDPDFLADIARILLNATLGKATDPEPPATEETVLRLETEGPNNVILTFRRENNKTYLNYAFATQPQETRLQNFAAATRGKWFEIIPQTWEEIQNVLAARQNQPA